MADSINLGDPLGGEFITSLARAIGLDDQYSSMSLQLDAKGAVLTVTPLDRETWAPLQPRSFYLGDNATLHALAGLIVTHAGWSHGVVRLRIDFYASRLPAVCAEFEQIKFPPVEAVAALMSGVRIHELLDAAAPSEQEASHAKA